MIKYYDVTFNELSGKSVVKRGIPSEREPFDVWQDACVSYTDKQLHIQINENQYTTMNRRYVVRVDAIEVEGPTEKQVKRHDELIGVINTLSNMGF